MRSYPARIQGRDANRINLRRSGGAPIRAVGRTRGRRGRDDKHKRWQSTVGVGCASRQITGQQGGGDMADGAVRMCRAVRTGRMGIVVMLMFVMAGVGLRCVCRIRISTPVRVLGEGGRHTFMSAINAHRRPGRLHGQPGQQEDDQKAAHGSIIDREGPQGPAQRTTRTSDFPLMATAESCSSVRAPGQMAHHPGASWNALSPRASANQMIWADAPARS